MESDRLEIVPNVSCPTCGFIHSVSTLNAISKVRKGREATAFAGTRGPDIEKTYIVTCDNQLCEEYRKVKFLKAMYVTVESKILD